MSINLSISFVHEKLAKYSPQGLEHSEFKQSAVLIGLIPTENTYKILLTIRSSKMKHHQGEISFPGGRFDEKTDKTLLDTVLRETYEEIGVPKKDLEIIGQLDDSPTISGYIIHPFVAILSLPLDFQFIPNCEEVTEIFCVPIENFVEKSNYQETPLKEFGLPLSIINIVYQSLENGKSYNIWGATAHLLTRYIKIIYDLNMTSQKYRRPTIEEIYEGRKQYELEKMVKRTAEERKMI
jgi:8-oxo-dGTP pyrophosphatase MutT (NUDIX family)